MSVRNRTHWLSELTNAQELFSLPKGVEFIVKIRADIEYSTKSIAHRIALYIFWENEVSREYPDIDWKISDEEKAFLSEITPEQWTETYFEGVHEYLKSNALYIKNIECAVLNSYERFELSDNGDEKSPIYLFVYRARKDLQSKFKHTDKFGEMPLLYWWHTEGYQRYPSLRVPISFCSEQAVCEILQDTGFYLPTLVKFYYESRPDLQAAFDLNTVCGLLDFNSWWLNEGENWSGVTWQSEKLRGQLLQSVFVESLNKYVPELMMGVLGERSDLQNAFIIQGELHIDSYISWWNEFGTKHYKIADGLIFQEKEGKIQITNQPFDQAFGVNIVGFSHNDFGLLADNFEDTADDYLSIQDVQTRLSDSSILWSETLISEYGDYKPTIEYPVSMYCLPPIELLKISLKGARHLIDGGDYKIGAWSWNLPQWPTALAKARDFVDEIWVQSDYVRQCFLKEGNVPVYLMPHNVAIPPVTARLRSTLGIGDDEYVFYLVFDGNSCPKRRNTIAGVKAFKLAFVDAYRDSDVVLVIKAKNINLSEPIWREIEALVGHHPKIRIITETMSRQDDINFMASCDCFISLHRSVAFGNTIAEAMLLQQPVIVSNYSGNVDFCSEDTAYLVDGDLVPLDVGDNIFGEGQYWFEADVEQAAQKIRYIYNNRQESQRVGIKAQQYIIENYSNAAVTHAYVQRLENIRSILNG
ncbi:glycosyltransferase [Enterovibrio sp. ZSDZ35]|uniref:Glycosyltransferase n=1 Tax=Enterovibrio qingdaonensis TaxID=2899818 RepID=A0ABT5QNB5_9GAMM|nr:glycosyltransferase [Enterovibrio sp. ZSDZ35]MDD1782482.1 glycosyltransferase [Enterovibrio sp. ZSDZ35]